MTNLAIYANHDSHLCVKTDKGYRIIEAERVFGRRNISLSLCHSTAEHEWRGFYDELIKIARSYTDLGDTFLDLHMRDDHKACLRDTHGLTAVGGSSHHEAHAWSAFYQSPYDRAVIIAYDGGGENKNGVTQTFTVHTGSKNGGVHLISDHPDVNLGLSYVYAGVVLAELRKAKEWWNNWLPLPGKLMAYAGFGRVHERAMSKMYEFIQAPISCGVYPFEPCTDFARFNKLFKMAFDLSSIPRDPGTMFAATFCKAWEDVAVAEICRHMRKYPGWPLVLTGGCALNVKVNQRLRDMGYDVFVPPNPNDCGLGLGMLLAHDLKSAQKYDAMSPLNVTFSGVDFINDSIRHRVKRTRANADTMGELLAKGHIVGLVRGSSEVGPRALGHRSLLMDPYMKDVRVAFNELKKREWFRPVSPVCRVSDIKHHFKMEEGHESPFMSFCPQASTGHHSSTTHVDGSARVQTVAGAKDELWNVLTSFNYFTERTLLANTSFNAVGKPILNTLDDAMNVHIASEGQVHVVVNDELVELA